MSRSAGLWKSTRRGSRAPLKRSAGSSCLAHLRRQMSQCLDVEQAAYHACQSALSIAITATTEQPLPLTGCGP